MMIGASRGSLTQVQDFLRGRSGDMSAIAAELFAIVSVVAQEKSLRLTLADTGQPVESRTALVNDVFGKQVSKDTLAVFSEVVTARWSSSADFVEATESLAAQAAFMGAQKDKSLGTVEDEIFQFGRILDGSAELQMALTDPASSPQAKAQIIQELLGKKVKPATLNVLSYYVANLHGRRVDTVVDHLAGLAAAQSNQVVAEVTSVIDLDDKQKSRLAAVLEKITGKKVRINVAIDKNIVGGLSIQIGDQIIDGSVTSRLEQARRTLQA